MKNRRRANSTMSRNRKGRSLPDKHPPAPRRAQKSLRRQWVGCFGPANSAGVPTFPRPSVPSGPAAAAYIPITVLAGTEAVPEDRP